MLTPPPDSALAPADHEAFQQWLGTSVAGAVERAAEAWRVRRVRRGEVALHVELETDGAHLYLANGPSGVATVDWRLRHPPQATPVALDEALSEIAFKASEVSSSATALGERLLAARSHGRSRATAILFSIEDEGSRANQRAYKALHALDGVRREGKLALPPWSDAHVVDLARGSIALPPELLAVAPQEQLHARLFHAQHDDVIDILRKAKAPRRVSAYRRTPIAASISLSAADGSSIGLSAGGDARRYRAGRRYATLAEEIAEGLDELRIAARNALFVADEGLRGLAEINQRAPWHAAAARLFEEVVDLADVWSYQGPDAIEAHLAARA